MALNPSGNFHWIPDYAFEETHRYNTLQTGSAGKERFRFKTAKKQSWVLNFPNITKTESTDIWNFYVARQGDYQSFTWSHPVKGTSYTVRFVGNSLERDEVGEDNVNMVVRLTQVF